MNGYQMNLFCFFLIIFLFFIIHFDEIWMKWSCICSIYLNDTSPYTLQVIILFIFRELIKESGHNLGQIKSSHALTLSLSSYGLFLCVLRALDLWDLADDLLALTVLLSSSWFAWAYASISPILYSRMMMSPKLAKTSQAFKYS